MIWKRSAGLAATAAALFVLAGCAGTMGGRKAGSTYTAPHGNYEITVPSMGPFGGGTIVQESSDEAGGRVSFSDDTGALEGITYLVLPDTSPDVMADVDRRQAAIRGFLHDYAMPVLFQEETSGAEVLYTQDVGSGMEMEYFAVVKIPQGSVLVDVVSGNRLDSTRSVLIFPEGGCMYMLEYDGGMLAGSSMEGNPEYTLPVLQELKSQIVFK